MEVIHACVYVGCTVGFPYAMHCVTVYGVKGVVRNGDDNEVG